MATTLFLFFLAFLVFQMPVSFCLIISTVLAMFIASDIDSIAIVLKLFRSCGNYHLIAIPFFYPGRWFYGIGWYLTSPG